MERQNLIQMGRLNREEDTGLNLGPNIYFKYIYDASNRKQLHNLLTFTEINFHFSLASYLFPSTFKHHLLSTYYALGTTEGMRNTKNTTYYSGPPRFSD